MSLQFHASLDGGEAVLRFRYHDGLRRLLRAVPGRRWDPSERVWRVPLDPERAESLGLLVAAIGEGAVLSEELSRRIGRLRARRGGRCVMDLARPDERWWLSFPTDRQEELVEALMAHPEARRLPVIGRALIPLDGEAGRLVGEAARRFGQLELTEDAEHALTEIAEREREWDGEGELGGGDGRGGDRSGGLVAGGAGGGLSAAPAEAAHDVEIGRDRRGGRWLVFGRGRAMVVRLEGEALGLRVRELVDGSGRVAVAAAERDGMGIAELLEGMEGLRVSESAREWVDRATVWRGTIDVGGDPGEPRFLLLGDVARLPRVLRERGGSVTGGVALELSRERWRLIEGTLRERGASWWSSEAAKRCIAAVERGEPAPSSVLEVSRVHEEPAFVLAPGHDKRQLVAFAALPGAMAPAGAGRGARRGSGAGSGVGAAEGGSARGAVGAQEQMRLPAIHADPFCVPTLDAFLAEHEPWVAEDALELLQEIREQHARAAGLVALSRAVDSALEVRGLGGQLKPFQRAGVEYLLLRRRAFLADEQGLGKTIEALAALEADGAYPAVVACPAALKLNWRREAELWLPGRRVQVLSGTRGGEIEMADVTIVNYEIVGARLPELAALEPRAVLLDESHYCKNPAAKRTQAAMKLAAAVGDGGLVIAMTGTPITNRPAELTSQLRILGRLSEFGSGAQFGRRFQGPDAHLRLHWHLRARCFVRRLKSEVLPQLPAKTRAVVPVELDNEPEYRLAERDLIAWLRTQPMDLRELDAKVAAAMRAERLVRLNALKLLAAEGKLKSALAWIHDFLTSGERLVVFAGHRKIQRAVAERFEGALHILGEDSQMARERALVEFQEEDRRDNQLIVCSMELAGHGITLTRSSNVAFLELDWTPAKHDQAEDRCHRIGQRDAVNATYLLAAGTVDETIAALLERKRAVVGAVTDGREEDEEGVVDALVRELRGKPYRHLRAVA